jgi:uncharacterized membrane protein YidH (DUF202 family)
LDGKGSTEELVGIGITSPSQMVLGMTVSMRTVVERASDRGSDLSHGYVVVIVTSVVLAVGSTISSVLMIST